MQGKFYIAGIVALPVWHEINHEIKTQNLSFFRTSWFKCWNSLPVGSWSQVFIPQRSIIAVDQFELTLQRKSRGKSDFGEEFLILTLQVALLCFLLAWHSRDPLLKHFTYFNISGRVCVLSGKFKGQCAFFRRHCLFDKVPSKISNTKWRCATVHIDIIGIIDIDYRYYRYYRYCTFFTEILLRIPSIPSNQVSGESRREKISQTFGRHYMTGNQFNTISKFKISDLKVFPFAATVKTQLGTIVKFKTLNFHFRF